MRSPAALALLRTHLEHPGGAFPTSASLMSVASSVALLPHSSPPSDSTCWSGVFDRFREGSGASYPQAMWILGDGGVEVAALGTHSMVERALRAGYDGTNESQRLRQLILRNLYPTSSSFVFLPDKQSKEPKAMDKLCKESKATDKLSKRLYPGQPLARSFSSGCNFDEEGQAKELKRIGNAVEEILKVLKDDAANKSSTEMPNTGNESSKPQEEDTPSPTVFAPGPLSKKTVLLLSVTEAGVKALREFLSKDSGAQVPLLMLLEAISLAKDPATKAALDHLMEQRSLKMLLQNFKSGEYMDIPIIESNVTALQPLQARVEMLRAWALKALAMLDEYSTPLLITQVIAGFLVILLQVTW